MKHLHLKIIDSETGITAEITPTSISIAGSKTQSKKTFTPYINDQSKYFIFQSSSPETVRMMANAFLRICDEQAKLNSTDFE